MCNFFCIKIKIKTNRRHRILMHNCQSKYHIIVIIVCAYICRVTNQQNPEKMKCALWMFFFQSKTQLPYFPCEKLHKCYLNLTSALKHILHNNCFWFHVKSEWRSFVLCFVATATFLMQAKRQLIPLMCNNVDTEAFAVVSFGYFFSLKSLCVCVWN